MKIERQKWQMMGGNEKGYTRRSEVLSLRDMWTRLGPCSITAAQAAKKG